jgi:hypothetical protein
MIAHQPGASEALDNEFAYLRGQLEGLESILFELMPFGVPLRRQEIQDFYIGRARWATQPNAPVANRELKRQFNVKANQVRNLVDCAESLGDPLDRFNLVFAACSLPSDRSIPLHWAVKEFTSVLLNEGKVDLTMLNCLKTARNLRPVEARLLLSCAMFLISEEIPGEESARQIYKLLDQLIDLVQRHGLLYDDDPFLTEACCVLLATAEE